MERRDYFLRLVLLYNTKEMYYLKDEAGVKPVSEDKPGDLAGIYSILLHFQYLYITEHWQ